MKKTVTHLNLHDDLIKGCRRGDRKSQFELYKLYFKAMFNTAARIVSNYSDAEDIMQEAFLKAFQNIEKYKAEVSFGAWLKRIVINQSLDYLRKRKVEFINIEETQDSVLTAEIENSWEIEENTDLQNILNEIKKLPDGYKIVLSLYLLEGYDHDEISEILNISPSTSRSQFMRARKKLIENLNENKNKK
jgi:RNA polymerase sigma-70 factor (ECF subfamily)